MKACIKCGSMKPLEEFYKHPQMGDGHLNACKECVRANVKANRKAKIDYYREYDRRRFQEDANRHIAQCRYSRRLRKQYPERRRARMAVQYAIRSGRLVKQPCEVCGSAKSQAHHGDYSRPLDVRWFCQIHHEAIHHAA